MTSTTIIVWASILQLPVALLGHTRRFERRNAAGLQQFNSYRQALIVLERLGMIATGMSIFAGGPLVAAPPVTLAFRFACRKVPRAGCRPPGNGSCVPIEPSRRFLVSSTRAFAACPITFFIARSFSSKRRCNMGDLGGNFPWIGHRTNGH
jgi:hypothetical protein